MQDTTAHLRWRKAELTGDVPTKRSGHTLTVVGTNGFLFGGCDYQMPPGPTNDLYILRMGAGDFQWSRAQAQGGPPGARWGHTANVFDKTKIVIFGGFHSSTCRFNDTWMFNTITLMWDQPVESVCEFTPEGNHVLSKATAVNVPAPRGGHSASMIGNLLYVFGGYGGTGYSRRDFNDLHALNLEEMTWIKLAPKGSIPEPRSNHSAVVVKKTIMVFGGWNAAVQFKDLFVLDTETMNWTEAQTGWKLPRWSLSACSVEAIPHWKVFVFGGLTGDLSEAGTVRGRFLNAIDVMDTGSNTWATPEVQGEPPAARSDTELAYDSKGSRLLLFGGWANKWFGDMYCLDVGSVVGPPYAIMDVDPKMGPITGGMTLTIIGIDFINTPAVVVRFTSRKGAMDVPGRFVSDTEITCETPNFSRFGAGEVDVRVSLKGDSFTTTFQRYAFHAVTDAGHCLAFGPGVLDGCLASKTVPTSFIIQARDSSDVPRSTGGDEFNVRVRSEDGTFIQSRVEDNEDGTYVVSYAVADAGTYTVSVEFMGTFGGAEGHVRGSPFRVVFDANAPKANNKLTGPLTMEKVKNDIRDLQEFTTNTLNGLRAKVPEHSIDALLAVKEHLYAVQTRESDVNLCIARARATIAWLALNGAPVGKAVEPALDAAIETWDKIHKAVPVTKGAIAPLVKTHGAATKAELADYENRIKQYAKHFRTLPFWSFDTGVEAARRALDAARAQQATERASCDTKKHLAFMFEFPELMETTLAVMQSIDSQLQYMEQLWDIAETCLEFMRQSRDMLWSAVDADMLEETVKGYLKDINNKIHSEIRGCDAFKGLSQAVKNYLSTCPLILALHHPSMRPRHWKLLQTATGKQFTPPPEDPQLKLAGLLALNLHEFQADVEEITDQALKEAKMEASLAKLEEVWVGVEWVEEPRGEDADGRPKVTLIKMSEEDFEMLEADQLVVQGMMGSRYLATFEERVTHWQRSLGNVADVVQLLMEIQRTWSYLEPLFIGSDEVKRELPEDAARFAKIDMQVKSILSVSCRIKSVLDSCNKPGLTNTLETLSRELELCKKALADFLDGKRRQFPRFYFVSEADLLDILSNGANPVRIMQHVMKVFLATETLTLTEGTGGTRPSAASWVSGVGVEVIEFERPIRLDGKVEIYLQTVLDGMTATLRSSLGRSYRRYPTQNRVEWLQNKGPNGSPTDPAQIAILVAAMQYVGEVEAAFASIKSGSRNALKEYNDTQRRQLSDLIRLTRTSLSKEDRIRVMVMITMDAHARDVITSLVQENVTTVEAFQWQSQLKQRLADEDGLINICDATFKYGFEYLGNGPRLVITPLTDRIYVTATQALNLKMGCAPAGPAGTGKTETTKDLASALGKCCYVFNCSPEMDYRSMGNIFKGLAASGSWGCFDEFNRLVPEVLSVCSVQFKAVCDGIRLQRDSVEIEGDRVSLDPTCGAFITMNPGYLGRSELPEGLKALFRPMTVMVPDLVLICENMMMAEGFEDAKTLATKFYGLYSLLRELLSKQSHYDWGLRAVKSVLVVAGSFKRAEPDLREDELLMRALRDFNTPKIVKQDEVVFFGLLGDLFPGVDPPRKVDTSLEAAVKKATQTSGLWPDPDFLLKVVQLEELLAIRHCVFVMGPPGCGKSACWKMLAAARKLQDRNTTIKDLNPKSISPEELYGFVTLATREWREGLLSSIMRDLGKIPDTKPKWIILDGDLDANWIESMNSVMDDNRMLTLANNERIPLKPHMRMIFEIRDLNYATPATVSRAGIIFISTDKGTQWQNLVASWIQRRPEPDSVKDAFSNIFSRYVGETLLYLKRSIKPLVPMEETTMVSTLLTNLEALLPHEGQKREQINQPVAGVIAAAARAPNTPLPENDLRTLEHMFVFAAMWAFGAALSEKDGENYRHTFSEWWKANWKTVKLPSRETIFDYWLDPEQGKFELWKNSPYFYSIEYRSSTPMSQVTVPTPETCSVSFWMNLMTAARHPVLLVGNAGCGKTQLVLGLLNQLNSATHLSTTINFNFYTTSSVLQSTMEGVLEKKAGVNYGPPGSAHMIFFLDDLNLPEVDPYNTQSAIALLRQHIDYEHWFDRAKLSVKNILNCQYVACMNPSAGSFLVNPRLQRHFVTFAIGFPGPTSLLTIYQTFLDGHLRDFNDDIQALSSNLINGALGLHAAVASTFRKTARNFHYEFNIRHLSNVFQGLLVAQPAQFKDPAKFVQLWVHESERVYGDRLVSAEDLVKYKAVAQAQAKKRFPQYNLAPFFAAENADPLIFCHFAENIQDKMYEQVLDMDKLQKILVTALAEYNEMNAQMDLVLFADALRHVCRISRIIMNPAGHALLVGVGGSGKQSLARLSAFICGYTATQITISASYSLNDLKEDLKAMYAKAGLKDEGVMFLFTDSQITNERFLVYMNDLLASGNIPDMYSAEDKDAIVNAVVGKVKAAGLQQDRTTCWNFFLNQVRKNLHVVLCFSPVGDDFRLRALRFPALVSCTVIDWFQPWPADALLSVGRKFLSEVDLGDPITRAGVEKFMPFSFQSVNDAARRFYESERRHCYTTPKSYLELLKLYCSLLQAKRKSMHGAIGRLQNGLTRLRETGEAVQEIEVSLKGLLERAEEKRVLAENIAEQVSREKAIVEKETAAAAVEARNCATIQAEVLTKQRDTEADLAKAEPMVIAAMEALDTLNKKDLGECKTMSSPPRGVDDVFAAVMVLFAGVDPNVIVQKNGRVKMEHRNWDSSKKALLANVTAFIDSLKGFKQLVDDNRVPAVNWKDVRMYLEMEHFTKETIEVKNRAAAGLCSWVINIVMYHDVLEVVEPKRRALAEANEKLTAANARLAEVQAQVAELQAKLDRLTAEFNDANSSRMAAQEEVRRGTLKLDLAQRLTRALGDENVRWAQGVERLTGETSLLVGDVLLASAFISYIGPFTSQFRNQLIARDWVPFLAKAADGASIPMSADANPVSILTTDAEVAAWNSQGLPADRVSTENGAIALNSARWPLMIDPQLQGIAWIRERESKRGLLVVRLGQPTLLQKLGEAVEAGTSVLIENMGERIDAVLMPVITRATIKKGHKRILRLGETELELHPQFRLFLHTKLSNPHYPPEIQAETTLINFTVTEKGLEDQLLALVVAKERPDLAAQRSSLIKEQNANLILIKELEDNILMKLAQADSDITEDVGLIEGLEKAKHTAGQIQEKMQVSRVTQQEIQVTSEKYRPVAARGALLFFLMNSMDRVHTYYMFSLNAFVVIFMRGMDLVTQAAAETVATKGMPPLKAKLMAHARKSIQHSRRFQWNADILRSFEGQSGPAVAVKALTDEELVARCTELMDSITITVYNYLRRGLFDRDKLTIAAQLCLKTMVRAGALHQDAVSFLVLGRSSADPGNMGSLSDWLPESVWPKLRALEELKHVYAPLESLCEDIQTDSDEWRRWFDLEKPEDAPCPGKWRSASPFERMLLLRALRPDRLTAALRRFVFENMGSKFVEEPPFDMVGTYRESSPSTPVFFVLFPGVDPTVWVEALGAKSGKTTEDGTFINISMGQGQEKPAEEALEHFAKAGGWIMLQNVHLMQSWLPALERKLELISETAAPDFRCFISAEPPPLSHFKNIPESLLQSCIKVANEAPADLRSNLTRAWANFSSNRVEGCTKPAQFKACLFSLCFFHAVVLGRRRFGQQGWSRAYSFNTGDLSICANVLESYLNASPPNVVPWDDLRYIFGEIMYGGHITDAWDRRTCNTYLQELLVPAILNGGDLAPSMANARSAGFAVPPVSLSVDEIAEYIHTTLPGESPQLFGLHPNSEIGYLNSWAESLFTTILTLEGAGSSSGSAGGGASAVRAKLEDLLSRLPQEFVMLEIQARAEPLLLRDTSPFVVVALQECTRMNALLSEIRRSLLELQKGLDGALNMSEAMEDLMQALSINQVPGRNPFHRTSWEKLAWFSKKSLVSWFGDMLARVKQLERWSSDLVLPYSLWLPGLFNPTAFLTAIMQVTARRNNFPLDNMTIETHVTAYKRPEECKGYPEDGAYVHGLFLEGARWSTEDDDGNEMPPVMLGNAPCVGALRDSKLKELLPALPVVYIRAVTVKPTWIPSSVGYLRQQADLYECPVYITRFRGPTYVCLATLRTAQRTNKWVLAGVAIIMQEDD